MKLGLSRECSRDLKQGIIGEYNAGEKRGEVFGEIENLPGSGVGEREGAREL